MSPGRHDVHACVCVDLWSLQGGGDEAATGLMNGVSGPSLKLMAEANSNDDEQRREAWDLPCPGPAARRNVRVDCGNRLGLISQRGPYFSMRPATRMS